MVTPEQDTHLAKNNVGTLLTWRLTTLDPTGAWDIRRESLSTRADTRTVTIRGDAKLMGRNRDDEGEGWLLTDARGDLIDSDGIWLLMLNPVQVRPILVGGSSAVVSIFAR
jgi:hypothetical protein